MSETLVSLPPGPEKQNLDIPPSLESQEKISATPPAEEGPVKQEYVFDRGRAAWLNLFGACMLSVVCYGMSNSWGVFQLYYASNQLASTPTSTISWVGSLQLCLILLCGSITGPLFDAGYLRWLIGGGGLLYVFSLMMTSLSSKYYQILLSQGVGVGIAMGCLFSPSMSTIAHHFKELKIIAFGVFAGGASIGGAVFPIMVKKLLVQVGFGWTVRVMGFIVLVCALCGFFCCTTQMPPNARIRALDFTVFRTSEYTLLVAGATAVALGLYAPLSYGVSFAVSHGMSVDLAFYSLAILNACSFIGRVGPNYVGRFTGPINILIFSCVTSGILIFVWTKATSTAGILVFNAFIGITTGGYVSSLPASITSISPRPQEIGLRLGMAFFVSSFGWLASSPIQGALIKVHSSTLHSQYLPVSIFSGLIVFVGVALMAASRHIMSRRKKSPWV